MRNNHGLRTVRMTAWMGVLAAVLCLGTGCPDQGGGTGGEEPGPSPVPSCGEDLAILNIPIDVQLSTQAGMPLTVVYRADASATNIRGLYVPVSSNAADATEGTEVVVAENLPTGEGQSFNIPLSEFTEGFYRVGIRAGSGNQETRCLAEGTIEVIESALPEFTLPDEPRVVTQGDELQVAFDLHDPSGLLNWRLFYIDVNGPFDVSPDELGDQIRVGEGDSGVILWSTGAVAPRVYFLGLSFTDSGTSIAETVDAGKDDQIDTILNAFTVTVEEAGGPTSESAPTLEVTQPAFQVNALAGEANSVQIAFKATIKTSNPVSPSIRVFRDKDGKANTGDEVTIADKLPPTATSATLNTQSLAEGAYFIGVTVDDGVNPPLTVYAKGKVVVSTDTLEVTAPDLALPVKPGTEITVEWNTNITGDGATVDVFRRAVDENGQPTGPEISILAATKSGVTSATFEAAESGLFQISVRYKFDKAGKPALVDAAPRFVRVSGLPLTMYVGDLAEFAPVDNREEPKGAVFEGHQFEDNAGSGFAFGDFDADGRSDAIISARYGKPEFINPSGIGEGEAYLFRGAPTRYSGSINLNSVSSSEVPGLVFTGPPSTVGGGFTTQGLSSVFVATDADGDGMSEILFGFPATSSFRELQGDIDYERQFESGGVVVVSSQNSLLIGGESDTRGARMQLHRVGLNFEERRVRPEPGEGELCENDSSWLRDFLSPNESPECPASEACPDDTGVCPPGTFSRPSGFEEEGQCPYGQENACWEGPSRDSYVGCLPNANAGNPNLAPDSQFDTIVEPKFGFASHLAINFHDHYTDLFGAFPCTDLAHLPDGPAFPCPSCDSKNPDNDPDCGCAEWFFNGSTGHWEPTDTPLCSFITNNYLAGWPDYDRALIPTEIGGDCADQVFVIEETIAMRHPVVSMFFGFGLSVPSYIGSGFFRDRLEGEEEDDDVDWNEPGEPVGARIIGRPTDSLHEERGAFGTSIAQSGNELIISAPHRDAVNGLDIVGLPSSENEDAGVAYLFSHEDLWSLLLRDGEPLADARDRLSETVRIPPKPHIYSAGGLGHTGFIPVREEIPPGSTIARRDIALRRKNLDGAGRDRLDQGGLTIAGRSGENIQNIIGIPDFNRDGRPDFVVGSPTANADDGAAYVVFRRTTSIEGFYALEKLALGPGELERLAGVYVVAKQGSDAALAASLAGEIDLNSNGVADVVLGAPGANSGAGEVIIVFASSQLTSPAGGISVDTILSQRQGARITGLDAGGKFGFNVANAGDIDGDGTNDLLIAAPGAAPMFDSKPNDSTDALDTKGLDRDLDGKKDDVTGPKGVPDGVVDQLDDLDDGGLVYVIFGSTDARKWAATAGGAFTISISKLGSAQLPGFIIAGRRAGDLLGGGDATVANPNKTAGRSAGLASVGDVDGDGLADFMIGSILADARVDPQTGVGTVNAGEAYLIYGFKQNE